MRTLTMAAAAALAWLPPAIPAAAQEPTIEEALEYLRLEELPDAAKWRWSSPEAPATHILRQVSGPRPAAELDAFADRVAAMAADTTLPERVQIGARFALAAAVDAGHPRPLPSGHPLAADTCCYPLPPPAGTPYPRAFDLLVRVYEGGTSDALFTIMRADPERGPAYVRDVFERSERPPVCDPAMGHGTAPECVDGNDTFHDTPWCRAGGYLFGPTVDKASAAHAATRDQRVREGRFVVVPEGMPEHVEDFFVRCEYSGVIFD
ncbi:MAG: hypothetical protein J4F34_01885 [Gemmatimonadetes bacterium]|nr:hypothetical protein [Gemmatimonadota bacterium]